MIKLSAVVITFNEAANIERCVLSLNAVADEILVVDSFSSDDTVVIAKRLGANVIQHKFEGHIQQKNYAASKSKHEFVLSLDADECLSDELTQSILSTKANWTHDGYYVNRLNNYSGRWIKHGGWYPDRKLRLWDRRLGEWSGVNPHDKYVMKSGARVGFLNGDLLHYSFASVDAHRNTIEKFSSIAAQELYKREKPVSFFHLYLKPAFVFVKMYLLKFGFLDGYFGFVIARLSAYDMFLRYTKLKLLYRSQHALKR